jgi:hypothetical protein
MCFQTRDTQADEGPLSPGVEWCAVFFRGVRRPRPLARAEYALHKNGFMTNHEAIFVKM